MKPKTALHLFVAVLFSAWLLASHAHAATYYWNNGNGVFQTGANWSNNAGSGGTTGTAPADSVNTDQAVFNQSSVNGNQTVQFSANWAINGITFNNTGTTTIQSDSASSRVLTMGNGGIVINTNAGAVTLGNSGANPLSVTLGANNVWTNESSALFTVAGNVTHSSGYTLTIGGSGNTTFSGNIVNGTGNLKVTKAGTGSVTLQGTNTYTGATTLSGGTLLITGTSSSSTLTLGGAVLQVGGIGTSTFASLTASSNEGGRIVVGANKTLAFATGDVAGLSPGGILTFNTSAGGADASTSTVGTSIVTFTGGTASSNMNVRVAVLDSTGFGLGALNASKQVVRRTDVAAMPTDRVSFVSTTDYSVNGSSAITITGSGTASANSITVDTSAGSGSLTLSSGISLLADAYQFGGTSSTNTYLVTGGNGIQVKTANQPIIINNQGGTLTIESPILRNGSGSQNFTGTGKIVLKGGSAIASMNTAINATILLGSVTLQLAGNSTFNSGNYSNNMALGTGATLQYSSSANQTIGGIISGSGLLVKDTNSSILTLTGNSTYTGATSVAGGTLAVNGALANTTVTIGSGGRLQGSGSIVGSVTIQGGGTLATGNSIESLATGTLMQESNSTFAYEINNDADPALAGDLTAVTGNLNLALDNSSSLTIGELVSGSWAPGDKLTLISYSGTWNTGLFTYNGTTLSNNGTFTLSGTQWILKYNDTIPGTNFVSDLTGSSYVTMVAVPEPTTLLSSALARPSWAFASLVKSAPEEGR
jgi:autotransporter-associated beta strand protein